MNQDNRADMRLRQSDSLKERRHCGARARSKGLYLHVIESIPIEQLMLLVF